MSRVPLASAEATFRRGGHGSQAMPNNSKWYSIDSEVPNLRVEDNICDSLRYACLYWAEHMIQAAPSDHKALQAHVVEFLHNQVLFWIEAMNLLQMSSQCARILLEVRDCVQKVRKLYL